MKANELIQELLKLGNDFEVKVVGIFNADNIKKSEEWSEDENYIEVETGNFEVYLEDKKQIIIQFFCNS